MSKPFYKLHRYDAQSGAYVMRPVMKWKEILTSEDAKQFYIGVGVVAIGVFGLWLGGIA